MQQEFMKLIYHFKCCRSTKHCKRNACQLKSGKYNNVGIVQKAINKSSLKLDKFPPIEGATA